MYCIDANVFLRFLLNDHPTQSLQAKHFFETITNEKRSCWTTHEILMEVIFVLESYYEMPKSIICQAIRSILSFDWMTIEHQSIIEEALDIYETRNIDFVDAHTASCMKHANSPIIISFDKHFDRIPGIQRKEP